jgi:hypothetical protein
MVYSVPVLAVANNPLLDTQWNALRDDILITPAGLATTAGQVFVSTAANAIAARTPTQTTVGASESTASSTYVDLTTAGPSVTVTTGATALAVIYCDMFSSSTFKGFIGIGINGATATDANAISHADSQDIRVTGLIWITGLTPGSNVFKLQYKTNGGTETWLDRRLLILPWS